MKKMRIKSVSFRSSIEIKQFQHVHVEASADVANNEDASEVLDELKDFVAHELNVAKHGRKVAGSFEDALTRGRRG